MVWSVCTRTDNQEDMQGPCPTPMLATYKGLPGQPTKTALCRSGRREGNTPSAAAPAGEASVCPLCKAGPQSNIYCARASQGGLEQHCASTYGVIRYGTASCNQCKVAWPISTRSAWKGCANIARQRRLVLCGTERREKLQRNATTIKKHCEMSACTAALLFVPRRKQMIECETPWWRTNAVSMVFRILVDVVSMSTSHAVVWASKSNSQALSAASTMCVLRSAKAYLCGCND